jgi:hypothetical protein
MKKVGNEGVITVEVRRRRAVLNNERKVGLQYASGSIRMPAAWIWEIYRAGRKSPIECSSVLYETVEAANRAGKEALKQLLTEFPA